MWIRNSEYSWKDKYKSVKSPRAQFHSFPILAKFYKTALSLVVNIGHPLPANQVQLPWARIKAHSELKPFTVSGQVFPCRPPCSL